MSFLFRALPVVCLCVVVAGCGGGDDPFKKARPKTVSSSGTITYNGQPLKFATIVLEPQVEGGVAAMGRSDGEGHFYVNAFPPDPGAVPGTYRVSVTKTEAPKQNTYDANSHDAPVEEESSEPVSLIPPKFGESDTSGLTLEIPAEGSETLKLDLM